MRAWGSQENGWGEARSPLPPDLGQRTIGRPAAALLLHRAGHGRAVRTGGPGSVCMVPIPSQKEKGKKRGCWAVLCGTLRIQRVSEDLMREYVFD